MTDQLKKLVESRHPEYTEKADHWDFLEDTYEGGREWFDENIFKFVREGDLESVQHMLLSVRELAVAQQQLCVNIRERATAHRSSLAAARRGEY